MATAYYADLHSHSTSSDGQWSPEAVVDAAADVGLQALALTDHDTLAGVERAVARGKQRNIEVIPGCELTVYAGNRELHMLALFVDIKPGSALVKLLDEARAARRGRVLKMGEQLRAAGIKVEDSDILEAGGETDALGQPHVAMALVKRGYGQNVGWAIRKYLHRGRPGFVEKKKFAPVEAIKAVHEAGGITLQAHPGLSPHDELIAQLFRDGMDGVEAFHQTHSQVNRKFYAGLARRYERAVSGGSDFHGPLVKPGVELGSSGVSQEVLEDLRNRAHSRRKK
jgi:predicted metal-dependent phosphoesterase TrpH